MKAIQVRWNCLAPIMRRGAALILAITALALIGCSSGSDDEKGGTSSGTDNSTSGGDTGG